jgi:hypothetical protein
VPDAACVESDNGFPAAQRINGCVRSDACPTDPIVQEAVHMPAASRTLSRGAVTLGYWTQVGLMALDPKRKAVDRTPHARL